MVAVTHPTPLVDTAWVAAHLDDPVVRLIEVDLDPDERLIDDPAALGQLLSRSGVSPETTIVVYGDLFNWGATLAFWVLHALGHRDMRLMNGGRDSWLAEGRPTTIEPPAVTPTAYRVTGMDWSARARLDDVREATGSAAHTILDVRLPQEYRASCFGRTPLQRRASALATSQVRFTCPGRPPSTRTAPSSHSMRCGRAIWQGASSPSRSSSRIAPSAAGPATPGSFSPRSLATQGCASTKPSGQSGGRHQACLSSSRLSAGRW
jgi:3-mercaptopyruvate sulfurtransferase SseA